MKYIKILAKSAVFLLLFAVIFVFVQNCFIPRDALNYQHITNFYEVEDDTLDAVYIGSSNCFVFWNSLFAWEEYGITVYPYACNALPFFATEHLIREARKTQPDAFFIVNVNAVSDGDITYVQMHNMLDCMPFSLNKMALINCMTEVGDYEMADRLEFYLPIVRYHTRWPDLVDSSFKVKLNNLKGATVFTPYFQNITDITNKYILTDKKADLSEGVYDYLDSLSDYIKEENVRVLFVTVPQARNKPIEVERYNAVNAYLKEKGHDTLNLLEDPSVADLDLKYDFYNMAHTNIHGSIKFTNYISEYLIENYEGFENKHDDPAYDSWDESFEEYKQWVTPHILDLELDPSGRDFTLSAPADLAAAVTEGKMSLSWTASEGAEGYAIYRRVNMGPWKRIGETDGTYFTDTGISKGKKYAYTAVPYVTGSEGACYGNFSYKGVSVEY